MLDTTVFDVTTFDVRRFDEILGRGLCSGEGARDGQMCIEAAICTVMDLPHGDEPTCVETAVREFKIALNDSPWSSPDARAAGLRSLGLAQLGSKGVVDGAAFSRLITERTIRVLIPALFRELFPDNPVLLAAALRCELEGTDNAAGYAAGYAATAAATDAATDAANAARYADYAARYADYAARYADYAAMNAVRRAANAANAVYAARYADYAANAVRRAANAAGDKYLILSAELALGVLKELKSPGCALL